MLLTHDVIIVGSGVAGMRAALEIRRTAPELNVAIVTKLYPMRASSSLAQDGIAAALGQGPAGAAGQPADDWLTHMYDTAKGGAFLGDQDAQELLCHEAAAVVYEFEHMGVPFSRRADGRLAQRAALDHSAPRLCYAADRTGHHLVQTLYGELVRYNVKVYPEWYMLGLVLDQQTCQGVTALDLRTGEVHVLAARATLLATGGYGQVFKTTTTALSATGDGLAAAYRAGLPLQNMEFVQFEPLGLSNHGLLVGERVRTAGGYLLNAQNERFMPRYAPSLAEVAPASVITQAIASEIAAGRGVGPTGDSVYLDLRHLADDALPDTAEQVRTYLGLNVQRDLVPVQPTADATLGGIRTDLAGQVLTSGDQPITGLFAAGQCAASVDGAQRLSGNRLLAAAVFGRHTGLAIATAVRTDLRSNAVPTPAPAAATQAEDEVRELLARKGHEVVADLRQTLQRSMYTNAGLLRNAERLEQQFGVLQDLRDRLAHAALDDKSRRFNTELIETLEFSRLLDFSEAIVTSALAREESRGAHVRQDFAQRDDQTWLKHSLASRDASGRPQLAHAAVRFGPQGPRFQPEA